MIFAGATEQHLVSTRVPGRLVSGLHGPRRAGIDGIERCRAADVEPVPEHAAEDRGVGGDGDVIGRVQLLAVVLVRDDGDRAVEGPDNDCQAAAPMARARSLGAEPRFPRVAAWLWCRRLSRLSPSHRPPLPPRSRVYPSFSSMKLFLPYRRQTR